MKLKCEWRKYYPVHPCAELFPKLNPQEFSKLRKSLNETGLQVPVILWVDSATDVTYLLDGRNRLDALEANGVRVIGNDNKLLPHLCDITDSLSSFDAAQLVFAANIHRRHLSEKERVKIAKQVLEAEKQMKSPNPKSQPIEKKTKKITAQACAVVGKPKHVKGVRGSTKSTVGQVAKLAGVHRNTARKHLNKTTKKIKPKQKEAADSSILAHIEFRKFLSFIRARQQLGITPSDHQVLLTILKEIDQLILNISSKEAQSD